MLSLIQQGETNGAIEFAESQLEGRHNNDAPAIRELCERMLLKAGRSDEAYERYGLSASRATTNLATYRRVIKKYPDRDPRQVLLDLIENSGMPGKWFAASKDAGFLDLAIECANHIDADPSTLIRAARDFATDSPAFSSQVALLALQHLLAGRGYEQTSADVLQAYRHLMEAADAADNVTAARADIDRLLDQSKSPNSSLMRKALESAHQRNE